MLNFNLESSAKSFLDRVFSNLDTFKIDLGTWEIDHLCYRTCSEKNYLQAKNYFNSRGICLVESEVNGRLIATYKLHTPIIYKDYFIDLIEVPAPKKGKITKEGFEHIEVVIDEPFDYILSTYPQCSFETKGMTKGLNPELEVEFKDCAVKFHHKSLEHIINIEESDIVMSFLEKFDFLLELREFTPCLSGTIPLGIHNEKSDLDILFNSKDHEKFQKKASSHFKNLPGFSIAKKLFQQKPSTIIEFEYRSLSIQLFCQEECVFKQQANQHFLAEGRLLKLLENDFKAKITELKRLGEKTELAFGRLLDLNDPYQEILKFNYLTDRQILDQVNN